MLASRNLMAQVKTMDSDSKQMAVGLILLTWLINGFNYISRQQYESDIVWAFIAGGLGATTFIGIFFPAIVLFVWIPVSLIKNKSLNKFNYWAKINIGLIIGAIMSFLVLIFYSADKS